ncbi:Membrane-bound lytic murein transglycosylase D [Polaribacter huanghezhanensis]|uniref:LysM peptidoglycan-binding domain-containing protein n=1 Tax=Polaribacter huanghezhanensis TaxID=1354726 RepID=UPI00264A3D4B|nr:LysM peptidoglycan-binding domain-containing protein [Polaribacter huanghezhanensis]WKD86131.1 Membrane-bound lytic murein transglycosylase D [Polaribacter huanghezhanensis]
MKHFKLLITLFVFTIAVSCGQQKKYITYKVKKGETMRIIAKKLDIATKDLLRLNPDVGRRPKPDTEIFIPSKNATKLLHKKNNSKDLVVKETIQKDTIKQLDDLDDLNEDFILHTVRKGDTFYSLTRYYNVLKSDLLALNPALSEGLKLGAILKIKERVEGEKIDVIYKDTITDNAVLKVALLLPFRATVFDTVSSQDIFKNRALPNIVTDFYLGAELAIDSLRYQGIQIDFSVFDTEDRNTKINDIITDNSLEDKDVIIGSIYSDETIKLANSVKAPLVFPIFSKAQTSFRSSRIVKTSPDKNLYKEKLLSYISKEYKNENIIIVGDSTTASITEITQIANILKQHDSIKEVHQIVPHYGYIAQERFLEMMKPDSTQVTNWVIIATNNDVIASDAINSLISFPDPPKPEKPKNGEEPEEPQEKINYKVKLFGFDKYDYVAYNKLAQLGFVYVTDSYVDESSLAARVFNNQYLRKNKALPSYYATRGFDVTYDVIMRLASGKDLYDTFKDGVSYRVESKFDFSKRLFGISQNRGLFLLEFQPDLSLKRIE